MVTGVIGVHVLLASQLDCSVQCVQAFLVFSIVCALYKYASCFWVTDDCDVR